MIPIHNARCDVSGVKIEDVEIEDVEVEEPHSEGGAPAEEGKEKPVNAALQIDLVHKPQDASADAAISTALSSSYIVYRAAALERLQQFFHTEQVRGMGVSQQDHHHLMMGRTFSMIDQQKGVSHYCTLHVVQYTSARNPGHQKSRSGDFLVLRTLEVEPGGKCLPYGESWEFSDYTHLMSILGFIISPFGKPYPSVFGCRLRIWPQCQLRRQPRWSGRGGLPRPL